MKIIIYNGYVFVMLCVSPRATLTHTETQNMKYLIQFELDGEWFTIASRSTFDAAKSKAKSERKAMNGAAEISVIREGDPECIRYKACENFQLA